jgi:hypothetical protein
VITTTRHPWEARYPASALARFAAAADSGGKRLVQIVICRGTRDEPIVVLG